MYECSRAYADAIERGVDVITGSAAPWPNTPEVHAAIDRAVEADVVFVWFHYTGSAIITSSPTCCAIR